MLSIFMWVVRCWGERTGKGRLWAGTGRIERSGSIGEGTSRVSAVLWAVCTKKSVAKRGMKQGERFIRSVVNSHASRQSITRPSTALDSRPALRSLQRNPAATNYCQTSIPNSQRRRSRKSHHAFARTELEQVRRYVGEGKLRHFCRNPGVLSSLWQLSKAVIAAADDEIAASGVLAARPPTRPDGAST